MPVGNGKIGIVSHPANDPGPLFGAGAQPAAAPAQQPAAPQPAANPTISLGGPGGPAQPFDAGIDGPAEGGGN
jgi:hypothetical protein